MSIRTGAVKLGIAKPPFFSEEPSRMNSHQTARLTFVRRLQMVTALTIAPPFVSDSSRAVRRQYGHGQEMAGTLSGRRQDGPGGPDLTPAD